LLGEVDITVLTADLRLTFTRTQEMVTHGESALFCVARYCLLVFVSESAVLLYSGRNCETSAGNIMFSHVDFGVFLTPHKCSTVKCGHMTMLSACIVMWHQMDIEGSSCDLIEILFLHLTEGTEEMCEEP
jgi:hypothetical protein